MLRAGFRVNPWTYFKYPWFFHLTNVLFPVFLQTSSMMWGCVPVTICCWHFFFFQVHAQRCCRFIIIDYWIMIPVAFLYLTLGADSMMMPRINWTWRPMECALRHCTGGWCASNRGDWLPWAQAMCPKKLPWHFPQSVSERDQSASMTHDKHTELAAPAHHHVQCARVWNGKKKITAQTSNLGWMRSWFVRGMGTEEDSLPVWASCRSRTSARRKHMRNTRRS